MTYSPDEIRKMLSAARRIRRPGPSSDHLSPTDHQHFAEKDAEFARNVLTGTWQHDVCPACIAARACHLRHHHHLYDCCTHCGNDERDPRAVRWRGRDPREDRKETP